MIAVMVRKHLFSMIVVSLFSGLTMFAPSATGMVPRSTIHPVVVEVNPSTPSAGQSVQCYVGLNETTESGLTVSIAANPASSFSSIPSSVNVAAGQSGVYFQATLASTASQSVTVSASANGESAQKLLVVAQSQPGG